MTESEHAGRVEIDLGSVEREIFACDADDPDEWNFVTEQLCYTLCKLASGLFLKEPAVLEVQRPVYVIGDIHGQFGDLLRILDALGQPPTERMLFLGDYVDRGQASLEVITTLLLLKIRYPAHVLLLRGNHEFMNVNRRYGFRDECVLRFHRLDVYNIFNSAFNCMPLAAVIDGGYFCCHGGISETLLTPETVNDSLVDILNRIERPFASLTNRQIETDLVWSDPMPAAPELDAHPLGPVFVPSTRGISFKFNSEATRAFLERHSLKALIRAHQVMPDGLSVQHRCTCVTVFSAPNYFNKKNKGAVLYLEEKDKDSEGEDIRRVLRVLRFQPQE